MRPFDEASHLHRQRGATRDDPAMTEQLPAGTGERMEIDAAMTIEPTILECRQHREITLINVGWLDWQPPVPRARREGPQ